MSAVLPIVPEFVHCSEAQAIIKAAGGRFLAIGGAASGAKVTAFWRASQASCHTGLGQHGKIQAWRKNPEYIELRKTGEKYAKFRSFAVEGQQ
jgi:uncharacterized protein (DUF1330 family)